MSYVSLLFSVIWCKIVSSARFCGTLSTMRIITKKFFSRRWTSYSVYWPFICRNQPKSAVSSYVSRPYNNFKLTTLKFAEFQGKIAGGSDIFCRLVFSEKRKTWEEVTKGEIWLGSHRLKHVSVRDISNVIRIEKKARPLVNRRNFTRNVFAFRAKHNRGL